METSTIVEQTKKLIDDFRLYGGNHSRLEGLFAIAKEFLRVYAGAKNEFLVSLNKVDSYAYDDDRARAATEILEAFVKYIENGLFGGISLKRKAQIDVVSDFLEQAIHLLEDKNVHAAVPAIIIGASLEEFLRNWVEAEGLSLGNRKPSIDTYMTVLRTAELITKQDVKDITSWGGVRNQAAHGEWNKVESKEYIRIILEGVNLFMRKYGLEKIT